MRDAISRCSKPSVKNMQAGLMLALKAAVKRSNGKGAARHINFV
jgi:hypothetical protein